MLLSTVASVTEHRAGMEIRTRLFLSIIAVGILLGTSGYLVYDQISKVGRSFDQVQKEATPTIIALGNIKSDFNHLVAAILAYSIHTSEDHKEQVEQAKDRLLLSYDQYAAIEDDEEAAEALGDEIFELIVIGDGMVDIAEGGVEEGGLVGHTHDEEGAAVPSGGGGEEHMHDEAAADEAAMHELGSGAAAEEGHDHGAAGALAAGDSADVSHLHEALQEFDDQSAIVRAELDSMIEANFMDMQSKQEAVFTDISAGTNLTIIITVAALGVVGGVGSFVAHSLARRVTQLTKTANAIAQGRLDEKIAASGSDEIAALACNFEHMRKSLVDAQKLLKSRNEQLEELNAVLGRANEQLKKLDKLKDEFISVASHELRSPIHPILGYASAARDGMIPSNEALSVIYDQALRLRQLANDILDVSRIESGTLPYAMARMNVHETLLACVQAVRPTVNADSVSLVANIDAGGEDVEIVGDAERLRQVFMNILGNAIKFTKKGSITVDTRLDRARNTIAITFSDTGGGIPADIMPGLFNKFVTQKVGEDMSHGTGLGLFISRAIVGAHGGTITAYNNNAGGATFRVELPVTPPPPTISGGGGAGERAKENAAAAAQNTGGRTQQQQRQQ